MATARGCGRDVAEEDFRDELVPRAREAPAVEQPRLLSQQALAEILAALAMAEEAAVERDRQLPALAAEVRREQSIVVAVVVATQRCTRQKSSRRDRRGRGSIAGSGSPSLR